jgi:hypothetical protein
VGWHTGHDLLAKICFTGAIEKMMLKSSQSFLLVLVHQCGKYGAIFDADPGREHQDRLDLKKAAQILSVVPARFRG